MPDLGLVRPAPIHAIEPFMSLGIATARYYQLQVINATSRSLFICTSQGHGRSGSAVLPASAMKVVGTCRFVFC